MLPHSKQAGGMSQSVARRSTAVSAALPALLSPVSFCCCCFYYRLQELKAVVPPSMVDKVDTASLISQAGASSQGKLTRKEFNEVLDKYFLA
jgi:hypothetical protein